MNDMLKIKLLSELGVMLLVCAGFTTNQAAAGDYYWLGSSNYFDVSSAWTPSGPPSGTDNAWFTSTGTYQVWWDDTTGNRTTDYLYVQNGHVTMRKVSGSTHTYSTTGSTIIDTNGWLTLGAAGLPL